MSEKYRLRRLQEKDIPGMLEWIHDPEINRWFRFDAESMTEERAKAFISGSFSEKNRHYAITDDSDNYLGTISLEEIDTENKNALFAISMRACAKGSGAAMAGTCLLLETAFGELGLERVYLNVLSDNIRAKRFYEKAGFHYEGCFRKHLKVRGTWHDWDWYSILKEEFYAGNN